MSNKYFSLTREDIRPWLSFCIHSYERPRTMQHWYDRSLDNIQFYVANYLLCSLAFCFLVGVTLDINIVIISILFVGAAVAGSAFVNDQQKAVLGCIVGFFLTLWILGSLQLFLYTIVLSAMGTVVHSSLKKRPSAIPVKQLQRTTK